MQPVFIFSLPRSGSTLLQRILAAHEEIATSTEPWVLLPLLYALRSEGVVARYDHESASLAIREFLDRTQPLGVETYRRHVRDLVTHLYEEAAGDARYFIDKTPRYHLVIDELAELFPDAKAIFLWRNPLAAAASMINTWQEGRWKVGLYEVDLFDGVASLVDGLPLFAERATTVRYEDLVRRPDEVVESLLTWLGLTYDERVVRDFAAVELGGTMGDPRARESSTIDAADALEKWWSTFRNPVRQRWAKHYLEWLGDERAAAMGYDIDEVRDELAKVRISSGGWISDMGYAALSAGLRTEHPELLQYAWRTGPRRMRRRKS